MKACCGPTLIPCLLGFFLLSLSQTTLSPPGPPAPAAAPFSPAAGNVRPTISARMPPALGPNPAPLAEQPRRDLPAGHRPPLLPSAASGTSTDLEARAPVQESVSRTHIQGGHGSPFETGGVGCGEPVVGLGLSRAPKQPLTGDLRCILTVSGVVEPTYGPITAALPCFPLCTAL